VTEHEDIYEDEGLEEVELEDDPDAEEDYGGEEYDRVAAASQAVADWERQVGVELSAEDFDHVARQVDLFGIHPEVAYDHTGPGRFEADLEATLAAVERERGAKLFDSDKERMWQAAQQAAEDPSVETDAQVWAKAKEAAGNLDSPDDIAAYIGERLAVPQEREEPSATVVDEDGEQRPGYDLDNPNERAEAIDRLMEGQDVAGYDSTYTTVETGE
jgi:hypothetical protein